jgi:hypothetical protein
MSKGPCPLAWCERPRGFLVLAPRIEKQVHPLALQEKAESVLRPGTIELKGKPTVREITMRETGQRG